jgi:hypothetical protein
MSDIQQMSVAMQRLVDFISMVTNSTLLRNNIRAVTITFFLRRPNLFAICNNTFSKWWESVKDVL